MGVIIQDFNFLFKITTINDYLHRYFETKYTDKMIKNPLLCMKKRMKYIIFLIYFRKNVVLFRLITILRH
jgi:hypothetical protein